MVTWQAPVKGGTGVKSGLSDLRRRSMVGNVAEGNRWWARGTTCLGLTFMQLCGAMTVGWKIVDQMV